MEGLELVQAHVYHRHGERTPEAKIPGVFPWRWDLCKIGQSFEAAVTSQTGSQNTLKLRRVSEEPEEHLGDTPKVSSHCYDGQLTDIGKQSTFKLGQKIRELYVYATPLLPAQLSQEQLDNLVHSRSTTVPRAIESLQNVLAGFLGPTETRPTIIVRDMADESLIPDLPVCSLHLQMKRAFKQLAHLESEQSLAALDPIVVPLVGTPVRVNSNPSSVELWDAFRAAKGAGIPLPKGITDDVMLTLEKAAIKEWFGGYRNDKWTQLAVGPLFAELDTRLHQKVSGKQQTKLFINSAHDTTISSILHGLKAYPGPWPQFTSNIRVELFQEPVASSFFSFFARPKHFIRVLYEHEPLKIPACAAAGNHRAGSDGELCTFEAFGHALRKYAVAREEWRNECLKPLSSTDAPRF